ncbi:hypothetical protein FRX31_010587 [Thalictrum thalictroides]|uniref:Uncharacterized protein n=1 Tax=Thalictrum thalictroides TaxID=46969 RepID=A0A7J6WR34_THATH|nr:hypothetical protein FRX31_010587 [Thalictrum thalictroides]
MGVKIIAYDCCESVSEAVSAEGSETDSDDYSEVDSGANSVEGQGSDADSGDDREADCMADSDTDDVLEEGKNMLMLLGGLVNAKSLMVSAPLLEYCAPWLKRSGTVVPRMELVTSADGLTKSET